MSLFTVIPEASAIVRDSKGGYYQLDVYERHTPGEQNPRVYIRKGGAYHYLRENGTSNPALKLEELVMDRVTKLDGMGRYVLVT